MKVRVKLFATLAQNVPQATLNRHPRGIRAGQHFVVELPANSTLADLVTHLALPRDEIKVTFVNGRAQPFEYQLQPEDEVGIFPPIGGG